MKTSTFLGANSPKSQVYGNTSFTQNLYKNAIAVFSDTIQIGDFGPAAEEQRSEAVPASVVGNCFEEQFRECQMPPSGKPGMSFQIFDEDALKATDDIKMKAPEEDKENMWVFCWIL